MIVWAFGLYSVVIGLYKGQRGRVLVLSFGKVKLTDIVTFRLSNVNLPLIMITAI